MTGRGARVAAFFLVLLVPGPSFAGGLTGPERAGQRIYREGRGEGPIEATLPGPGLIAPATGFPCVKCHLEDGRGTLEGGVRSADISYDHLTKDYRGVRPSGRSHPAYTDETLGIAITRGVDPGGNLLHEAHPWYRISQKDLADLVAYLKVLGREPVPGVTDNEVRVGMLYPRSGPIAEAAADARAMLSGYFDEVNAGGGLFGRSLRLVPFPYDPNDPADPVRQAGRLVEGGEIFCALANVGLPSGDNAARILSEGGVPVLAPLQIAAERSYGMDRNTFHIFPSLRDQGRVLADFAADNLYRAGMKTALLYAGEDLGRGGAAGAREQANVRGLPVPEEVTYLPGGFDAAGAAGRLERIGPGIVFYFGGGKEAAALLAEADRRGLRPFFLAPAALIGDSLFALPARVAGNVYLSAPVVPPDRGSKGAERFFRISQKYRLRREHAAFQVTAFAGAMLLEEGLRGSGRSVTRNRFTGTLNGLRRFSTGVTPPLTYDENRRVGALGAGILTVDTGNRRFVTAVEWQEPSQGSRRNGGERK